MVKKDFNEYRFAGLEHKEVSNKYLTMRRLNADETKIVVKVSESHIQKTKYGYALILDYDHVVFVKDWQVSDNYYGVEVLLTKDYWNVKEWGTFDEFGEEPQNYEFNTWVEAAKEQQDSENIVRWAK